MTTKPTNSIDTLVEALRFIEENITRPYYEKIIMDVRSHDTSERHIAINIISQGRHSHVGHMLHLVGISAIEEAARRYIDNYEQVQGRFKVLESYGVSLVEITLGTGARPQYTISGQTGTLSSPMPAPVVLLEIIGSTKNTIPPGVQEALERSFIEGSPLYESPPSQGEIASQSTSNLAPALQYLTMLGLAVQRTGIQNKERYLLAAGKGGIYSSDCERLNFAQGLYALLK
jgi:hypothetical protein